MKWIKGVGFILIGFQNTKYKRGKAAAVEVRKVTGSPGKGVGSIKGVGHSPGPESHLRQEAHDLRFDLFGLTLIVKL